MAPPPSDRRCRRSSNPTNTTSPRFLSTSRCKRTSRCEFLKLRCSHRNQCSFLSCHYIDLNCDILQSAPKSSDILTAIHLRSLILSSFHLKDLHRHINRQPTKKTFHCCSFLQLLFWVRTHLFRATHPLVFSCPKKGKIYFNKFFILFSWWFKFEISHISFQ